MTDLKKSIFEITIDTFPARSKRKSDYFSYEGELRFSGRGQSSTQFGDCRYLSSTSPDWENRRVSHSDSLVALLLLMSSLSLLHIKHVMKSVVSPLDSLQFTRVVEE